MSENRESRASSNLSGLLCCCINTSDRLTLSGGFNSVQTASSCREALLAAKKSQAEVQRQGKWMLNVGGIPFKDHIPLLPCSPAGSLLSCL